MEKYDVIIVGAGNGGLSAAALASKKGLKTLLLEKHNLPGGAASSFRRGRFEFEPSLHEMAELGTEEKPGATRKLFEEIGTDWKIHTEDTTYRVICTDPEEQFDATLPCGIEKFCLEVEKVVPGSYDGVKKFFDYQARAMKLVAKLTPPKLSVKDLPELINLMKWTSYPAEKVMDMFKIPKKAQHIISVYWPYSGEPTNTTSAFMMGMMDYIYIEDGAGMPSMTSHEISLSLDKVIRENGGQIFYNSPVSKILIKNQTAYGVVANGKEYYADHVICNCHPNVVYGNLIATEDIPEIEVKKVNARELGLSFVTVYLGLNKSAQELGIKDYTVFLHMNADPKKQYEESHGLGGKGWVIANNLNVAIPDCTPEGTCQMCFTTSVYGDEWGKIKPEDYKKTKYRIAEEMIDYYEKTLGVSIKPYIEEIEVATPVTFSRYLGSPNGTPYGYQNSDWDGIFMRTVFKHFEKPLKGLHFAGASTEGSLGYNQTYKSGRNAVEEILNEKK